MSRKELGYLSREFGVFLFYDGKKAVSIRNIAASRRSLTAASPQHVEAGPDHDCKRHLATTAFRP
jgi:hypothetical protein